MSNKIELLAPGGDTDSIKAAILAGADAIYCGLDRFNARNRASNISFDELLGVLRLAHKHNCEVFVTVNIIIIESEIPSLISLLNKLVNTSIDGIIIQDLGLFYLLNKYFKSLKLVLRGILCFIPYLALSNIVGPKSASSVVIILFSARPVY